MNCIHRKPSRLLVYGDILKRLQSSAVSSDIQIPNRIERSPTDILKALETTISRDFTAPRYKYRDDPYLIPQSSRQYRSFALSRESGKKAAMWILKEHADLFQHKLADPMIPSFAPPVVYNEKSTNVTEQLLLNIILNGEIEDAINVYNLLESVSAPIKLALLELLCFSNAEAMPNPELLEEKWYSNVPLRKVKLWKSHPKIEQLFESLKLEGGEITFAAYNALICGTAKYLDVNKAWELFEECKEKKIPLNLNTYNYIITLTPFLKEDSAIQKQTIVDLLGLMASNGISPNTLTLSACMKASYRLKNKFMKMDFIRTILAEFHQLDIKPSLATYYYLLLAVYNQEHTSNGIIMSILSKLEKQSLMIVEEMDTSFFSMAMNIAERNEDRNVGDRIHNLLLSGENYKFLGDNQKENMYYRSYARLMLKTESFKDFMKFYIKLVPNVYVPEMSVMEEIVYHLEISTPEICQEYLPKIWSHVVTFNFLDKPVAFRIINIMRTNFPKPLESNLYTIYNDAVNTMWNDIKNKCQKDYVLSKWTAELLGDMTVLFIKYNNFDAALEVIDFATIETGLVIGVMHDECLKELSNLFILQGHSLGVLNLIKYALINDSGEAISMAQRLNEQIPLSGQERNKLIELVGESVLEMKIPQQDTN